MTDGAGYTLSVEGGPVYQHDDAGTLRRVEHVDLSRPFFLGPGEEAAHEQGDVCDEDGHAHDAPVTDGICGWCGEGVGQWLPMGYTSG